MDFNEKTYLIVGGSSGIGLASAKKLTETGARVILVSSNKSKQREALRHLNGKGHIGIEFDLNGDCPADDVFKQLGNLGIRLDGMIYSAGVSPLCLLKDNNTALVQQVFNINVFSFIEFVRCFQKTQYSKKGSRIIAIASITAHGSGYRQTLYGSSKAALIAAVRLMSKELLNRDIRINCISPGVTETPMLDSLRLKSDNLDVKITTQQPLGIIPSETIAESILFLLAEGSDYMTGNEWILDAGGML